MKYKAHHNTNFVIVANEFIEYRFNDGQYIHSVCCLDCVDQLEKAIKQLKKLNRLK